MTPISYEVHLILRPPASQRDLSTEHGRYVERHHASTAILLGYDGGGGYFYLLETGIVAMFYDEWQWATMSSLGAFVWADLHCQRLSNAGTSEQLDALSDSDVRAAANFGMPEEYLPSVGEDESDEPPSWLRE